MTPLRIGTRDVHCFGHCSANLLDEFGRCLRWRHKAEPLLRYDLLVAEFGKRWNLRQEW